MSDTMKSLNRIRNIQRKFRNTFLTLVLVAWVANIKSEIIINHFLLRHTVPCIENIKQRRLKILSIYHPRLGGYYGMIRAFSKKLSKTLPNSVTCLEPNGAASHKYVPGYTLNLKTCLS